MIANGVARTAGRRFRAAVWRGGDSTVPETLVLDAIRPHEVLIRVNATNMNISEYISLHPANRQGAGPFPQVLGHGTVGIVEAVGEAVSLAAPGDRVLATSTPQCGRCWFCLRGRAHQCAESRFVGDVFAHDEAGHDVVGLANVGGFAELAVVPEIQVTRVETSLSDGELALLGVAFGSGIGAAFRTAPIEPGTVAAAIGLGVSGQAYIQAARLAGAAIIIGVDPHPGRRERAARLGATHVVDPTAEEPIAAVHAIGGDYGGFQGAGADYVFESTASVDGMKQAWDMARVTGHVILSSVPYDMSEAVSFPAVPLACFSKTIHSNQYGGLNIRRDIPWAIDLIERGLLDTASLMDASYKLDEMDTAVADVAAHKVLGASIVFP